MKKKKVRKARRPGRTLKWLVAGGFRLLDPDGKERTALGLTPDRMALVFGRAGRSLQGHVAMTDEGPALLLIDANGKIRVMVSALAGAPRIELLDAKGEVIFKAPR
jgi:hypothetical protein